MLVSGRVPTVDGSEIRQSNHLGCIKPVGNNGRYLKYHLSNEKRPSCLGYIGDYTTQLTGNHKPL